jgi:Na+-translocating ferredoxin:NAD+ oxidoreductase RnfD subunit
MNKILDERYFLHRYKATSHAGIVIAVLVAGFFLYYQLHEKVIRWDLAIPLVAGAVTKVVAMIYYRRTE